MFASLGPDETEAQIEAWVAVLERAGFGEMDLIHLHHLTPMHNAAARRFPDRPVVTHLHGTALKMLDRIRRLEEIAATLGTGLGGLTAAAGNMSTSTPLSPAQLELLERTNTRQYAHGTAWATRLVAAARRSRRIVCISPHDASEAIRLLGVPEQLIEVIPNGVDTDLFTATALDGRERLALFRRWPVDDPQGWDESGKPGSVRYAPEALDAFVDRAGEPIPALIFVGRFLAFKRVPLLVRAYALARQRLKTPAPLVVWGAHQESGRVSTRIPSPRAAL